MANDFVKDNEQILNESCIKLSKEKERIKINFYKQNPTKSKNDLISIVNSNIIEENINIEKRGKKIDLKKKANFKEIPDRSNLKNGYNIIDLNGNKIKYNMCSK